MTKIALKYDSGKPQWTKLGLEALGYFIRPMPPWAELINCVWRKDLPVAHALEDFMELYKIGPKDIYYVMEFGAEKYGWDNWKHGIMYSRYIDAFVRHMLEDGEDGESGLLHVHHAAACLYMLAWSEDREVGEDDRG